MLVTGGTGTLGRQIVDRLLDRGQPVRVLSRTARQGRVPSVAVDLRTGAGLDAALDGVGTVVHCASGMGKSDVDAARNLVRAARAAGSPHVVYISIVGIDRVPLGYYKAKLATERVLAESGLPLTILRTTQFHDLLGTVFGALAKSPVVPAFSAVRFQPIDSGEVAERMTELALGEPKGRVADMGGPRVLSLREALDAYLRATGRRRLVLPVPLPGALGRALREGGNLTPDNAVGTGTFEQYLARV
ncbi:SDR family oxidoreductase [Kutzneria albida]|nr:SDR family oxidoreductase [Kutzneria albida]